MKWQSIMVAGLLATLFLTATVDRAAAQRRGDRNQPGTTIQLPRFGFQTTTTTVTVPDRGTVLLGGIKSLRESRNELGVPILGKLPLVGRGFRNVGIGREVSSQMTTVTPYIHDFAALERELLGSSPRLSSTRLSSTRRSNTSHLANRRARDAARDQFAQVERVRRDVNADNTAEPFDPLDAEQAKAESYYAKARDAYRNKKVSTARIYLRMAAKRASGDLRTRVLYAQNAIDPRIDALAGR